MASAVLKPHVARDAEVRKLAAKAAERAAAVAAARADSSIATTSASDASKAEAVATSDGGYVGPLELRCTAGDADRAWFALEAVPTGTILLAEKALALATEGGAASGPSLLEAVAAQLGGGGSEAAGLLEAMCCMPPMALDAVDGSGDDEMLLYYSARGRESAAAVAAARIGGLSLEEGVRLEQVMCHCYSIRHTALLPCTMPLFCPATVTFRPALLTPPLLFHSSLLIRGADSHVDSLLLFTPLTSYPTRGTGGAPTSSRA